MLAAISARVSFGFPLLLRRSLVLFVFYLFGDLMGLPMLEEPVVGGYHDMVRALQKQLNKVLVEKNPLQFSARGFKVRWWGMEVVTRCAVCQ